MNRYYSLITGASQGFGKVLAIECARLGMNLVLVSLPGNELHILASLIRSKYGVAVVCIEKDLCENESCANVFREVSNLGIQVNMLFNNAGVGDTGLFTEGSCSMYEKQIKLNVLATTLMTRHFVEMLKANSPSYILNVGSLASFFSLPNKQVYGATKSFVYYFSRCLRKELRGDKVYVSVLCPGGMNTNVRISLLIKKASYLTRLSCMEPESVVPAALHGLLRKQAVIIPGKLNRLFIILDTILPAFIKNTLLNNSLPRLKASPSNYNVADSLPANSTIMA